MTESVHIFLGPSLPVERAREVLDAQYHPPVRVGDVLELVLDREPPAVIGIVDGLFEQVPTVWHKEILYAISRGAAVFGASSMGALRAAELHAFHMIGVGEVFEAFRDGRYNDDDEVAIVHAAAEDGYRPLSDAMVSLREGVARAVRDGVLGAQSAEVLLAEAKSMFYPDRGWTSMCQAGLARGVPAEDVAALKEFVATHRPDVKRDDALRMLHRIRDALDTGLAIPESTVELEPTYYWDKLCRTVRNNRTAQELETAFDKPAPQVHEWFAQEHPDAVREALLNHLLVQEAERIGLVLDAGPAEPERIFTALERGHRAQLTTYLVNHKISEGRR